MFNENCLYIVITEEYCNKPAIQVAAEAIDAGIDCLQMREKAISKEELLEMGSKLKALCKNIPFIVNDDPYLAKELDADGVHLGQDDFNKYPDVRKIMGRKIMGISTHSIEEVERANDLDVDYIAYGPIFETKTKDYSIGIIDVENVLNITTKPVVFIGGINEDNVYDLIKLGAKNIAVIRAITQSIDIKASVKKLKSKINCHPDPALAEEKSKVSSKRVLDSSATCPPLTASSGAGRRTPQNDIKDQPGVFITLNGKKELVKSGTLSKLLKEKKLSSKMIIVEYNKEVANPSDWDAINLKDNDNLEIVGMFSGG